MRRSDRKVRSEAPARSPVRALDIYNANISVIINKTVTVSCSSEYSAQCAAKNLPPSVTEGDF